MKEDKLNARIAGFVLAVIILRTIFWLTVSYDSYDPTPPSGPNIALR